MPKEPNPDVVLHKLRTLARRHGWVLARWELHSEEHHTANVMRRQFTLLQRRAIRDPKHCSGRVAAALVRKGIFAEDRKLTKLGKALQTKLNNQKIWYQLLE